MTLKIAVASKDGLSINQHFGHAREFWIYALNDGRPQLIERREVENYCLGQSASQTAMAQILHTIQDCTAVLSAKIGEGPVQKLQAIQVHSVTEYAYEGIDEAVQDYFQQQRMQHVQQWVSEHLLSAAEIDCVIAVMLKILDGKCKMNVVEKQFMSLLYDAVRQYPGLRLSNDLHQLIAESREQLTEDTRNNIYEQRVLAETMISRPVMKAFKARIRALGLFQ